MAVNAARTAAASMYRGEGVGLHERRTRRIAMDVGLSFVVTLNCSPGIAVGRRPNAFATPFGGVTITDKLLHDVTAPGSHVTDVRYSRFTGTATLFGRPSRFRLGSEGS